jgi:NAD(P)-dependent dehydrogenase (short-subunit alcohol dehydrogenase family)
MAMGELDGTVVVVTGANRGLGAAIAFGMAREGARLVAAARDVSSTEGLMRRLQEVGADCMAVAADVLSEESMAALAAAVLDRFGRADVVVANAGVTGPTRPMHEITLEEWRLCLAADLDGVFLTFRPFVPRMIEQGGGSLIAISSMTGKRPLAGRTPYAAAKMGVIGLCRSLALELGPHGVRVNSVCPGAVSGPRIVDVIREQARLQGVEEEAARRQFTDPSAFKRLVEPEEVAAACVYLASARAAGVTGEDLNVSAGTVMY